MGAKQSVEVTRALRMVQRGMTPYAAAKRVGIALSTIYRAIAREMEERGDSSYDTSPGGDPALRAFNRDCAARTAMELLLTGTPIYDIADELCNGYCKLDEKTVIEIIGNAAHRCLMDRD